MKLTMFVILFSFLLVGTVELHGRRRSQAIRNRSSAISRLRGKDTTWKRRRFIGKWRPIADNAMLRKYAEKYTLGEKRGNLHPDVNNTTNNLALAKNGKRNLGFTESNSSAKYEKPDLEVKNGTADVNSTLDRNASEFNNVNVENERKNERSRLKLKDDSSWLQNEKDRATNKLVIKELENHGVYDKNSEVILRLRKEGSNKETNLNDTNDQQRLNENRPKKDKKSSSNMNLNKTSTSGATKTNASLQQPRVNGTNGTRPSRLDETNSPRLNNSASRTNTSKSNAQIAENNKIKFGKPISATNKTISRVSTVRSMHADKATPKVDGGKNDSLNKTKNDTKKAVGSILKPSEKTEDAGSPDNKTELNVTADEDNNGNSTDNNAKQKAQTDSTNDSKDDGGPNADDSQLNDSPNTGGELGSEGKLNDGPLDHDAMANNETGGRTDKENTQAKGNSKDANITSTENNIPSKSYSEYEDAGSTSDDVKLKQDKEPLNTSEKNRESANDTSIADAVKLNSSRNHKTTVAAVEADDFDAGSADENVRFDVSEYNNRSIDTKLKILRDIETRMDIGKLTKHNSLMEMVEQIKTIVKDELSPKYPETNATASTDVQKMDAVSKLKHTWETNKEKQSTAQADADGPMASPESENANKFSQDDNSTAEANDNSQSPTDAQDVNVNSTANDSASDKNAGESNASNEGINFIRNQNIAYPEEQKSKPNISFSMNFSTNAARPNISSDLGSLLSNIGDSSSSSPDGNSTTVSNTNEPDNDATANNAKVSKEAVVNWLVGVLTRAKNIHEKEKNKDSTKNTVADAMN